MKAKTKSRIAFGIAGALALALLAFLAALWWFAFRATSTDPNPNGAADAVEVVLSDGTAVETEGIDWDYWLSVNPEIVGWIRVPGTGIDYPIVHAPDWDPDYYLHHDVYNDYNPMGAIYLDCECDGLFSGGNSVIFGHHYSDTMFAPMSNYSDAAWAREHRTILMFTPDGETHVLDVQSADVIRGTEPVKRTTFSDRGDLMAYWQERFGACDMKLADEAQETSQLFMFVTCSYNFWPDNERTTTFAIEDDMAQQLENEASDASSAISSGSQRNQQ